MRRPPSPQGEARARSRSAAASRASRARPVERHVRTVPRVLRAAVRRPEARETGERPALRPAARKTRIGLELPHDGRSRDHVRRHPHTSACRRVEHEDSIVPRLPPRQLPVPALRRVARRCECGPVRRHGRGQREASRLVGPCPEAVRVPPEIEVAEQERDLEPVGRAEESGEIGAEEARLLVPVEAVGPHALVGRMREPHSRLGRRAGGPHPASVFGGHVVARTIADDREDPEPAAHERGVGEEEELHLVPVGAENDRHGAVPSGLTEDVERRIEREHRPVPEDRRDIEHAAEIPRRRDGEYLRGRLRAEIAADVRGRHPREPGLRAGAVARHPVALEQCEEELRRAVAVTGGGIVARVLRLVRPTSSAARRSPRSPGERAHARAATRAASRRSSRRRIRRRWSRSRDRPRMRRRCPGPTRARAGDRASRNCRSVRRPSSPRRRTD